MSLEVVRDGALPPILAALLLVSLAGVRLLPLAVAVGLFIAHGLLTKEWLPWPHELWQQPNGTQWLLWGVIAAAATALLEHLRLLPARVATVVGLVVAAVSVWLMTTKLAQRWAPTEVWLHVGVGGVVAGAAVLACRGGLARAPAKPLPAILFAILLSVDAAIVTLGNSALLGQLVGAVAAATGAAVGTTLWRRAFALRPADGIWLGTAHALFVLAGPHLAYLSWPAAACALAAPVPLLWLPRSLQQRPLRWFLLALPLVLAPLAVAVWLSIGDDPYGY